MNEYAAVAAVIGFMVWLIGVLERVALIIFLGSALCTFGVIALVRSAS